MINQIESYFGSFWIARMLFLRCLAGLYLVAFLSAFNQFPALLGEHGLEPVTTFVRRVPFRAAPSIFQFMYSDQFFMVIASLGIFFSLLLLFGAFERGPAWVTAIPWLVLWIFYLSIVNVGQTFYSFGWESMLLEAGFFAAFFGSRHFAPSLILILILRWMLFRLEFGSGLIKLRNDPCWLDLTCLFYHYETQPIPNPLSWYFHYLPGFVHRSSVLISHFIQVVVPFGLFGPQWVAAIAGGLIIAQQVMLVISGNYSWLNWLTIVIGITAFSDSIFMTVRPLYLPAAIPRPWAYHFMLYALAIFTLIASVRPAANFFSRRQLMNYNYNPLHLVNSYGAFGTVTKKRYEVVIEGTMDPSPGPGTTWEEYEFKGKPGRLDRMPPQVAPYHLRLDWLMWFLPFSVHVRDGQAVVRGYDVWFLRFVRRLLEGDKKVLALMRPSPFPGPPRFIRARYYLYQYTTWDERRMTGNWWKRTLAGEYMPPVSLRSLKEP